MKKTDLHLKFAKALYKLAEKNAQTAKFFDELTSLKDLCSDQALIEVLESLAWLEVSVIRESLVKVLNKACSEEVINMFTLLVANRQVKLLPVIYKSYQRIYFQAEGIKDILVCTSREFSAEEKEDLTAKLSEKKHKIHVEFSVDENLIGGLQIYNDGKLTDFSIKNQLEHLRRHLIGEHIV